MEADGSGHLPVLPGEVVSLLSPGPGKVFLDCTLGRGGHASLLIPALGPGGRYIGLDVDGGNVSYSRSRLAPIAERSGVMLDVVHANFRTARRVLDELGVEAVDGLLADLGFASNQMDDGDRGLSFSMDGPLDMRLDPSGGVPAEQLVNTLPERELADLIYEYGEERLSRRIARKIVESRRNEPIKTTGRLAELVRRAYPRPKAGRHRIDPATRTFMALRIAVNDELGALSDLLAGLPGLLAPGGCAAIISFHSLEDRRVKHAFRSLKQEAGYELLTRKPVTAEANEIESNPRSRSAKLRAIRRPGPTGAGGER